MKNLVLILAVASVMFSCSSNPSEEIIGTWVPKDAEKDNVSNDTVFIERIEGDKYSLRGHAWDRGEKKAFITEVVFKDNTLYFPNNKFFTFTENKEFLVGDVLFKKIE